jgi:hypothetical protein
LAQAAQVLQQLAQLEEQTESIHNLVHLLLLKAVAVAVKVHQQFLMV